MKKAMVLIALISLISLVAAIDYIQMTRDSHVYNAIADYNGTVAELDGALEYACENGTYTNTPIFVEYRSSPSYLMPGGTQFICRYAKLRPDGGRSYTYYFRGDYKETDEGFEARVSGYFPVKRCWTSRWSGRTYCWGGGSSGLKGSFPFPLPA